MNKLIIAGSLLFASITGQSQIKEGKVIYDRTTHVQLRLADDNGGEREVPQTRNDKFELSFANNKSLWKGAEQEMAENDEPPSGGGGMVVRFFSNGSNDVLFSDFAEKKTVEQREFFEKKFIIDDSIRPLKWKMTDETKTILNHLCTKAVAVNYSRRMMMNVDNGKVERKEVNDTSNIIAWFASDIPVSAGPAEYQGQLPGLILAMDINDGRQVFEATEITGKADLDNIKAPTGKKHYTRDEFQKERDKMMDEMQRNNGGGNRTIRIN